MYKPSLPNPQQKSTHSPNAPQPLAFAVGLNTQIVGKCAPSKLSYKGAWQNSSATMLKPALTAKLAPSSHHRTKCDRYWTVCNHVGKQFGGLYYKPEVDYIAAHFRGRTGLIEPNEFGAVADRAITFYTKQMGGAS